MPAGAKLQPAPRPRREPSHRHGQAGLMDSMLQIIKTALTGLEDCTPAVGPETPPQPAEQDGPRTAA